MLHQPKKVGILVGGGPAPGITIEDFQARFAYLVENEPVPRSFFPEVVT